MIQTQNSKQYDLEDGTLKFAKEIRGFVRFLEKDITNLEDAKQLVRASGSVGANYIEANESLSRKDFLMRIKICRKEPRKVDFGSGWLMLAARLQLRRSERNSSRKRVN